MLKPPTRIFWLFANVLFGLLPSLAFFVWVERNASLPAAFGFELGWPWLSLVTWPVPALAAWDAALFLGFGFLHSLFAQLPVQRVLTRVLPPQAVRSFYMGVTGLSLLALMGLWQNTGVVLWLLPLPTQTVNLLSLVLFWGLMAGSLRVVMRFDALSFVGLRQLYQSRAELTQPAAAGDAERVLDTTGLYAWVRHPIYLLTSLAFVLTPFMTLDRALLFGAMALYLAFAIPVEERKLVALFGAAYQDYRRQVPAVVPFRRPHALAAPSPAPK